MTAGRHTGTGVLRPLLSGLWRGLSWGLLGLTLMLAAVVVVVPAVVGAVPLTVLSPSMEPTLPVGSLAVVRPVDPADVALGDVITYLPHPDDPTAVTHRVVEIDNHQDGTRSFVLQGDANTEPDAPVQDYQVRGEVWYSVPWLGHVNTVVNGEGSPAVYVVAALFFLWAGRLWWRAWRARGDAPSDTDPDTETDRTDEVNRSRSGGPTPPPSASPGTGDSRPSVPTGTAGSRSPGW